MNVDRRAPGRRRCARRRPSGRPRARSCRCGARSAARGLGDRVVRERPQRDRPHVADAVAGGAQLADRVLHELGGRAERDDDRLRVVEVARLDAHLAFHERDLRRDVLRLALLAQRGLAGLADAERRHAAAQPAARARAVDRPVLVGQLGELDALDRERLLRVREEVVAVEQHGVAPLVGEVERELHELDALGHVLRREHDVAVVAVPAAARRLVVVLLAARHVEDDERQLGERDLRERLLHEREALAGRAGRGARAGRRARPTPCRPLRAPTRR